MFSRKSGLIPGFTTIRKGASECNGIVALHIDRKALQEEISFTLILLLLVLQLLFLLVVVIVDSSSSSVPNASHDLAAMGVSK